ncbi:MAG: hypothetical protein WB762_17275 [Candidatus Sulfotelmatobacter sp.]
MQRAQRGIDHAALDVATANDVRKPVVMFFAPLPFSPNAHLRHYHFLAEGISDLARAAKKRNIGFVLGRFSESRLLRFCDEANPRWWLATRIPCASGKHGASELPEN